MASPLWGGGGGGRRRGSGGGMGTLSASSIGNTGGGRPPLGGSSGGGGGSSSSGYLSSPSSSSRPSFGGSARERERERERGRGGGGSGGDGMSEELRRAYALKSWRFIGELGKALDLGKVATHTALVFFHRFFKHQSYARHDRLLVATACVYLAAKVEERHNVKLSQIVVRYLVLEGRLPQDVDPAAYNKHPEARELVPKWKDRVITYERDLLYTMAFDLNVTHPFKALQDLMKAVREVLPTDKRGNILNAGGGSASSSSASLGFSLSSASSGASDLDHRTLFAQACKFLNDSFSLPSMVEAEPSYSAALALYLALALYEVRPPAGKSWLEVLGVADEARFLEDCLLAVGTYAEAGFKRLNIQGVPDPHLVGLGLGLGLGGGGGGGHSSSSSSAYGLSSSSYGLGSRPLY